MYYYEGLKCPVCHHPFHNGEDIVVCPVCGLPHHRSCWMQIGQCQMADKHGTDEQWSRSKIEQPGEEPKREADDAVNTNICANCHTRNKEFAEFCEHCGAPLKASEWSTESDVPVNEYTPFQSAYTAQEIFTDTERIGTATARELASVVGNNASYYIPQFRRLEAQKKCGWNWGAFLLAPFWLLYRKQYLFGSLLLIARILFNVFSNYWLLPMMSVQTTAEYNAAMEAAVSNPLMFPIFVFSVVLLIVQFILGFKGNALYKYHCEEVIRKNRQKTPDISSAELASVGGTSAWLAIISYFLSNLVSNAVLYFLL